MKNTRSEDTKKGTFRTLTLIGKDVKAVYKIIRKKCIK